jgi:hypothetical protein
MLSRLEGGGVGHAGRDNARDVLIREEMNASAPPPPRFAWSPSPVNVGGYGLLPAAPPILTCEAGEGDRRRRWTGRTHAQFT